MDFKEKLTIISDNLNHSIITEQEARKQIFVLLGVSLESFMKATTKRRLVDIAIFLATFHALYFAGAGFWALLILPFGFWNYYDGLTRPGIES